MTQRNDEAGKIWSAPALEELTVDLAAIAASTNNGNDGTGGLTKS